MRRHLFLLSAGIVLNSTAAEITHSKAAKDFDYVYTLDSNPTSQDLDNNGAKDWDSIAPLKVSGGFATNSDEVTQKHDGIQLFQGDYAVDGNPSIFRTLNTTPDAAWTIEVKVARTGGQQSKKGWFGIATANKNENNSNVFLLKDHCVTTSRGDHLLGSNFTTGKYHTVRVAHAPEENAYFFWVDGRIVNYDVRTPIYGNNGTGYDNSVYIGDYAQLISGLFSIDSIAITQGAFAPLSSKLAVHTSKKKPHTPAPATAPKRVTKKTQKAKPAILISVGGIDISLIDHD